MRSSIVFLLIMIFSMLCATPTYSQDAKVLSKGEVTALYRKLYESSKIDSIKWNGNVSRCACGQLPKDIYVKAENRVNFFRAVSGLRPVKINAKFNIDAQNAALLIKANNELTHNPTANMKCYNKSSANGCNKSCLGMIHFKYFGDESFITHFINDYGDNNYFVGHRKWILYTKLKEFGYGATNTTDAVLTADGYIRDTVSAPEYMAYPWAGYVPVNLIFPKWSFSIPQDNAVDYQLATVSMFDNMGLQIQTEKLKEYKNFLDHTLVWTAKGLFTDQEIKNSKNKLEENGYLNKKIRVLIQNVKVNGEYKNFEYYVEPFKL